MIHHLDVRLERLRRLPPSDAVWQLGSIRLPLWVDGEGPSLVRPWAMLARCGDTGQLGMSRPKKSEAGLVDGALDALLDLARQPDQGCRPERVEFESRELRDALEPALVGIGVASVLCGPIPELDEPRRDLAKEVAGSLATDGYFTGPDVSVERVRAYAEAAAAFLEARPWKYLSDEDLVRIESPLPERMSPWFTVLGGAALEFGLGFFESQAAFERIQRAADAGRTETRGATWLQGFAPVHEVPIPDSELWERHDLPRRNEWMHPILVWPGTDGRFVPAPPTVLTFMEGLMRVMAATTEDEIDGARWRRRVHTFDGEVEIALCIPALLEDAPEGPVSTDPRRHEVVMRDLQQALEGREFKDLDEVNAFLARRVGKPVEHRAPTTPAERARDLVDRAFAAVGRQRARLARQALALWPDCVDAYVIRAEEMPDVQASVELYREGVRAGERAIGATRFEEWRGRFWGILDTRPYMRARSGLALALWEDEQQEEALTHWEALLRLDPDDHLGVRYEFIAGLLELKRTADARGWLHAFDGDPSASIVYSNALALFQAEGDAEISRSGLRAAIALNPHVVKYLLDPMRLPEEIPESYAPRTEEEAMVVARGLELAWDVTTGAVEWLGRVRRDAKRTRKAAASPKRRGATPKRRPR